MGALLITLIVVFSMGGMFFSCIEIYDQNKEIRDNNRIIGELMEKNKTYEYKLKSAEKIVEDCVSGQICEDDKSMWRKDIFDK